MAFPSRFSWPEPITALREGRSSPGFRRPSLAKIERPEIGHHPGELRRQLDRLAEFPLRPLEVAAALQDQAEPVAVHRQPWIDRQGRPQLRLQFGGATTRIVKGEQLLHRRQ